MTGCGSVVFFRHFFNGGLEDEFFGSDVPANFFRNIGPRWLLVAFSKNPEKLESTVPKNTWFSAQEFPSILSAGSWSQLFLGPFQVEKLINMQPQLFFQAGMTMGGSEL